MIEPSTPITPDVLAQLNRLATQGLKGARRIASTKRSTRRRARTIQKRIF